MDTFQLTNLPLELDPLVEDSAVKMTGQVQAVTSLSEGVGLLLPYNSTEITGVSSRKNFEYSPELQTVLTQEPLKAGTTYQVEAIAPNYTKEDLRKIESLPSQAPGFELKWFTGYYDGLLPGVEELTAEAKNPYDKIELMADYLRTNGTYTLDPARSSPDMMTDFFATGEGYCVQFSSALTLMAQSLGYPARWVVGFSEGEPLPPGAINPFPDEPRSTVRVLTQADAHAWAEVYFPGYGWIPFEATPGYSNPVEPREKIEWPAATLPDVEGTDKSPRDIERDIKEDSYSTTETSITSWVLAGLAGGLGILGGIYWYWRHWYARLPERKKMQMLYRKWVRRLRFGGIKVRSNETPHEFTLRTKHLGAEWETVWSDFTGLAEEAYYAPEVDHGQLVRMQALAQRLKLIYRKGKKS